MGPPRRRETADGRNASSEDASTGPDPIARINALTSNARTTWFALMGVLGFVGLTLMSVTHIDFYGVNRTTQLPLLNVSVPTQLFFYTAPVLIVAVYGYFHLYLIRLWDALAYAPAQPGGLPLGRQISPWLVNDAALHLRNRLRKDGSTDPRALEWTSSILNLFLAWLFGLTVMGFNWWRSMPARDFEMTLISAVALLLMLQAGFASAWVLWHRMRGDKSTLSAEIWRSPVLYLGAAILIPGILYVSYGRTVEPTRWVSLAPIDLNGAAITEKPSGWLSYPTARRDFQAVWCSRETLNCTELTEAQAASFRAEWQERRNAAIAALVTPDLAGRDLRGADLRGAFLTGAKLSGTQLDRADFSNSHLEQAQLARASLSQTTFTDAHLQGADLSGVKGSEPGFLRARLTAANLSAADLPGAQMDGADLNGVMAPGLNLNGALMRKVQLSRTQLVNAQFEEAALDEAVIEGTDLTGATLTGAKLNRSTLKGSKLAMALLANAELNDADMANVTLTDADLSGTLLRGTTLYSLDADGADFSQSDLSQADLRQAKLRGADLTGAQLFGTNLTGADLADASLTGADMADAILNSTVLERAQLIGTKMRGADITASTFVDASLDGADLRKAIIDRSVFRKATLAGGDLRATKFLNVNLYEADLNSADLRGARIEGGDLRGVSFRNADLRGAYFGENADLWGIVLNGTDLAGTAFQDVDLAGIELRHTQSLNDTFTDASTRDIGGGNHWPLSPPPCQWMTTTLAGSLFTRHWRGWMETLAERTGQDAGLPDWDDLAETRNSELRGISPPETCR